MSAIETVLKNLLPKLEKAVQSEARKLLKKEIQPLIRLTKAHSGAPGLLRPCPVTGVMNSHRRFSYLMPEARTPANLAKYNSKQKKLAAKASSLKALPKKTSK